MKMLSRLLGAVLAVMLCMTSVFALAETETTASAEDVLALVNGTPITRGEVEEVLASIQSYYSQYGYDVSSEEVLPYLNQMALETAVQTALMDQKAIDLGIVITDEEKAQIEADVAQYWEEVVTSYVDYYGGLTEESTEEEIAAARVNVLGMLESMGYTEAVLVESEMSNAKYEKVEAEMIKGAVVADTEVQAAYDARVLEDEAAYKEDIASYEYMTQYYGETSYYTPEGYRGVTHILLEVDEALMTAYADLQARLEEQQNAEETTEEAAEGDAVEATEEPVTQEQVDAAYAAIIASVQPTIDEINQKMADGATFAEMIELYGTDPGMKQEPNKSEGYPVHMDSIIWDPAFVKGAFMVDNVGDIADPVVGSYGVHIIQYTRDVPSGATELTEELRSELYAELLTEKENAEYAKVMDQWMNEADIVYSTEAAAMLPAEE